MDWKPIKSDENGNPERPSINSGNLGRAEQMAIFAQRLFSFYHEQELAANPEIFLAGVVELFCNYPPRIVERAISPAFGLPAKFKFPPRIAEIREFLEEKMAPIRREDTRRQVRERMREEWGKYLLSPPRSQRPTYDELNEKYGDNWGLAAVKTKSRWQSLNPNELKALVGEAEWNKIPNAK